MKKNTFLIIVIGLLFSLNTVYANNSSNKCKFDYKTIKKEFEYILHEKVRFQQAEAFLKAKEKCISSDYDKAVFYTFKGDVFRFKHIKTHEDAPFKMAKKYYDSALRLNTRHSEITKWKLSMLMLEAGKYKEASAYINYLLSNGSKENEVLYLGTALEISVLMRDWGVAQKLVNILYNKNKSYYLSLNLLMPTVITFCHYKKPEIASKFIKSTLKARPGIESNINFKRIVSYHRNDCKIQN